MAKELMTWREKTKRWVKKYNGEQHGVSCRQLGTPKTKAASRDAANAWWTQKLAELEEGRFEPSTVTAYISPEGVEPYAQLSREELIQRLQDHAKGFAKKLHSATTELLAPSTNNRRTAAQIKTFLDHKKAQAENEIISIGRWAATKRHLEIWQQWIGDKSTIDEITPAKLREFYNFVLANTEWSRAYKSSVFTSAKSFIRFLGELELISIPGNLSSKNFKFGNGTKKIKHFSIQEVKHLLAKATDQTKLYLLLMINCGMYQSDISDLLKSEVDWQQGTITRKRSKTADHAEVPEVTYPLWAETFKLLKKFKAKDGELALTTAKGKPLKQESIVDGKLCKTDNIQSAYRRLQIVAKIPAKDRKPLKLMRKTGAQLLENNEKFSQYVGLYLGHSPKSMAEKHYANKSQKGFAEAIEWLEGEIIEKSA